MSSREPFYKVGQSAYLFAPLDAVREKDGSEEAVRQWCAFELIRAYGYRISDLTFEQNVKVGSVFYRIDILVKRNGVPWIIVECKKPEFKKHADGLAQAVSYADAATIRAEFVVYTNGSSWNVSRRIGESWTPVIDIPSSSDAEGAGSIDELLLTLQRIQPILHKLDERIEEDEARVFLCALQVFFVGPNLLTSTVDKELRFGTDCVLRVLSTGISDDHYSQSTLGGAARQFEAFRKRIGVGHPLPELLKDERIGQFISQLMTSMATMVEGTTGNIGIDVHLVRINVALLDYGRDCTHAEGRYPPITPQINEALRGFLTHAFAARFNIRLPSSLDAVLTSDMKPFCSRAWGELMGEEKAEARRTRNGLFLALLSSLRFWRRAK